MITRIRRGLFSIRHVYLNPIDRQRASVLLLVNWIIVLTTIVWILVGILPRFVGDQFLDIQSGITSLAVFALSLVIYRLIQSGRLTNAIWLFVILMTVAVLQLTLFWAESETGASVSTAYAIALMIPMVAAGVLLNRRGMVLIAIFLVGAVLYAGVLQSQTTTPLTLIPAETVFIDAPIIVMTIAVVLLFLLTFTGNLERIANQSLSDIQQRQWITEFGIQLGAIEDESQVLVRALDVVRDRFQYIFAQFYLLDEANNFNRTMRYGSSQIEAATREVLNLGDINIINEAAKTKKTALTTSDDVVARRAHLITSANYGVAVPIVQQNVLLGVLDVQSAGQNAFSPNELQALALVADQVGIALLHARTVNDLRRSLSEQSVSNSRLQAQVADYTQRERRGVSSMWSTYLQGRGKTMIGYNIEADNTPTPFPATDVPETLEATLQSGELHVESAGDEQIVNVPITFRDQTLGAMSFAVPKGQELNERQIEMAQIVAERLALALENTRLFEQSQAQANRERKASEVSGLLIGATDVYSVLNLAAQNFNEALGAIHTRIYIQPGMFAEPLAETREEGVR
jgi:GAF domain-containing protein